MYIPYHEGLPISSFRLVKAYPHPPRDSIDFGKIMSGSWRLVWRHKFLWFFGLFAGGSTSLGGWNCNYSSDSGSTPGTSFPRSDFDLEIRNWISSHLTLIVVVIA